MGGPLDGPQTAILCVHWTHVAILMYRQFLLFVYSAMFGPIDRWLACCFSLSFFT